jgi:rhodanese-related sulfurtransferase
MSLLFRAAKQLPRVQPSVLASFSPRLCSLCVAPRVRAPVSASTPSVKRHFLGVPGVLSTSIGQQPAPDGHGTIPVVLVGDAKKMWSEFEAVVDVREKNEVDEGMIPGALHIPLAVLLANPKRSELQGKKVLVYCRAGIRSAKGVQALQNAGIDAVNLGGGYLAWQGDK